MQKDKFVVKHRTEIMTIEFLVPLFVLDSLFALLDKVKEGLAKDKLLNFERVRVLEDSVAAWKFFAQDPATRL